MLWRRDSSDSYHTHHSRLSGQSTLRQKPRLHTKAMEGVAHRQWEWRTRAVEVVAHTGSGGGGTHRQWVVAHTGSGGGGTHRQWGWWHTRAVEVVAHTGSGWWHTQAVGVAHTGSGWWHTRAVEVVAHTGSGWWHTQAVGVAHTGSGWWHTQAVGRGGTLQPPETTRSCRHCLQVPDWVAVPTHRWRRAMRAASFLSCHRACRTLSAAQARSGGRRPSWNDSSRSMTGIKQLSGSMW